MFLLPRLITCVKRLELLVKFGFTFLVGGSAPVLFQFNGLNSTPGVENALCNQALRITNMKGRLILASRISCLSLSSCQLTVNKHSARTMVVAML